MNLVDAGEPLSIIAAQTNGPGLLLSLDNGWFGCTVRHHGGPLWISDAKAHIKGGMSRSAILAEDGMAIRVMCTGGGVVGEPQTEGGPNPRLLGNLRVGNPTR